MVITYEQFLEMQSEERYCPEHGNARVAYYDYDGVYKVRCTCQARRVFEELMRAYSKVDNAEVAERNYNALKEKFVGISIVTAFLALRSPNVTGTSVKDDDARYQLLELT